MIVVERLAKSVGGKPVLREVSLNLGAGVIALTGRNGAGKSTLMRVIAGLWRPDAGRVLIGAHDVHRSPVETKRLLGYQPELADLHPLVTGRELLRYAAAARGLADAALSRAVDRFDAGALLDEPAGTLSQGQRRVLTLVAATMHEPPVLLLDEPTNALDPQRVAALLEYLRSPSAPRVTLVSTHQVDVVRELVAWTVELREGVVAGASDTGTLTENRH